MLTPASSSSQIQTVASQVANTEINIIQLFINVGARNFALLSPADVSYYPAFNPGGIGDGSGPIPDESFYNIVGKQYHAQTFLDLENDLVPLAKSDIRIFYLDLGTLNCEVARTPGLTALQMRPSHVWASRPAGTERWLSRINIFRGMGCI